MNILTMLPRNVLFAVIMFSVWINYGEAVCCNKGRDDPPRMHFGVCGDCTSDEWCCGIGPCNIFCCNCAYGQCIRGECGEGFIEMKSASTNSTARCRLKEIDSNADEKISPEEFEAFMVKKKGDKEYTTSSLKAGGSKKGTKIISTFHMLDTDKNGFITLTEIDADAV